MKKTFLTFKVTVRPWDMLGGGSRVKGSKTFHTIKVRDYGPGLCRVYKDFEGASIRNPRLRYQSRKCNGMGGSSAIRRVLKDSTHTQERQTIRRALRALDADHVEIYARGPRSGRDLAWEMY